MQDEKPVISVEEFKKFLIQDEKPKALTEDRLQEYAILSLNGLRGLSRSDKLKVIRRMRRLME